MRFRVRLFLRELKAKDQAIRNNGYARWKYKRIDRLLKRDAPSCPKGRIVQSYNYDNDQ